MRLLGHAWVQLALVAALGVLMVRLAGRTGVSIDVTRDGRFRIHPASAARVARLTEPVTATVLFSDELAPPYDQHAQVVVDLLHELARLAPVPVDIRVRHPDTDPSAAALGREAGLRPVPYVAAYPGRRESRAVWLGVVWSSGTSQVAVGPIVDLGLAEHALMRGLDRLDGEPRTVGWALGAGMPDPWRRDPDPVTRLRDVLVEAADVVPAPLDEVPPVDGLLVLGPSRTLTRAEARGLEEAVGRGIPVAVFASEARPDYATGTTAPIPTGLDGILGPWGLAPAPGLVADPVHRASLAVPSEAGWLEVPHALVPRTSRVAEDVPAMAGVAPLAFPLVAPVAPTEPLPVGVVAEVWAWAEPSAGIVPVGGSLDPSPTVDPVADLPLLVALSGDLPRTDGGVARGARVLVARSADVALNNPAFAANLADWLVDDPSLAAVRARARGEPVFTPPARLGPWRVGLVGGPLLLWLGLTALARRRL